MRKLLSLLLILFLYETLPAQDIPPGNPSLRVSIVSGYSIVFNFDDMDEYKNGIMNGPQSTFIRVGSITNWQLHFSADQDMFYGDNDPTNQMELNNVGVVVVSTGTNLDDGSNIINYAKTAPIALESNEVLLLTKGSETNKGYGIRNAFTLNWEMGTQRGNMKNLSILEQMIEADSYSVNIILTVSVIP
ncbi:MAG: hypothetical protein K9G67_05585 [Bacteroidales bacterium]|nr:hypothetical protein [Bacteroidales bacterium]MCF8343571.1 hypothetical protein [Bacteroidales bacterium]MCF8350249.1 hypothetical protein [Bacteroidales bacterium]MCF8375806.1 hypothetical protein [Bacteroidales bacterium]MCF8401732.1 hypothetical protein [Bacteroidales bacterium]